MEGELWIWRPILAGKITLADVKSGLISVTDIFKLNALLDMQDAISQAHYEGLKDGDS